MGRIVDLLRERGLDQNTLILFTSDNGPARAGINEVDHAFFNSSGGLRGEKATLYEGGIRVPFIAWWPGRIASGSTCELVAHQDDLMATFSDLAGVPQNPDSTGGCAKEIGS